MLVLKIIIPPLTGHFDDIFQGTTRMFEDDVNVVDDLSVDEREISVTAHFVSLVTVVINSSPSLLRGV